MMLSPISVVFDYLNSPPLKILLFLPPTRTDLIPRPGEILRPGEERQSAFSRVRFFVPDAQRIFNVAKREFCSD
jgi:hypothetical protein